MIKLGGTCGPWDRQKAMIQGANQYRLWFRGFARGDKIMCLRPWL